MIVSLEKRVAALESAHEAERKNYEDCLKKDFETAVAMGNGELAAEIARELRDKLLKDSDSRVALDRFGIQLPENITSLNLLTCFKELIDGFKNLFSGEWAAYRKALRDIPQQSGFPFAIVWPKAPGENEDEEN